MQVADPDELRTLSERNRDLQRAKISSDEGRLHEVSALNVGGLFPGREPTICHRVVVCWEYYGPRVASAYVRVADSAVTRLVSVVRLGPGGFEVDDRVEDFGGTPVVVLRVSNVVCFPCSPLARFFDDDSELVRVIICLYRWLYLSGFHVVGLFKFIFFLDVVPFFPYDLGRDSFALRHANCVLIRARK